MAYHKEDHYDEQVTNRLVENYKSVISELGEDVNREGILKTPERVAKAMQYMMQGYQMDAREILHLPSFMNRIAKW